jgi:hypothetical protein
MEVGGQLHARTAGPQSQSGLYGVRKSLLPLPRSEPRLLDRSPRSLAAIRTALSRFLWNWNWNVFEIYLLSSSYIIEPCPPNTRFCLGFLNLFVNIRNHKFDICVFKTFIAFIFTLTHYISVLCSAIQRVCVTEEYNKLHFSVLYNFYSSLSIINKDKTYSMHDKARNTYNILVSRSTLRRLHGRRRRRT